LILSLELGHAWLKRKIKKGDNMTPVALMLAALLCSLVAGFLFAFAVVVMPGIAGLNNKEFIRSFQRIDGVIQGNQPLFMLVWPGSVIALLAAVFLSGGETGGIERWLLILATVVYLAGVQLPTFIINIPLNNRLQSLNVDAMDEAALATAREAFEGRWNRWNNIRTLVACLVSAALIALVLRY